MKLLLELVKYIAFIGTMYDSGFSARITACIWSACLAAAI